VNEIDPLQAFGLLNGADLGGEASRELGQDQSLVEGPPRLGELIDERFRLLRPLGRGGMGTVFLGRDEELEREVAIKVLSQGGESARQRFAREAEVTASLSHPHVIRIHDSGRVRGHPYLVYELVPGGRTLEDALQGEPLEVRLDLIEQVAAGLAAAHEVGVVHRDLKPENVLIRPDGTAVVLDFGLAGLGESSLTRTGQTMGTPAYMAPEQVRGETATSACDVWALGLLLYEAVYQEHALLDEGSGLQGLLARIYEARVELPRGGKPALRKLIQRTLVSDPAGRPQDAQAFVTELRAARAEPAGGRGWRLGVALGFVLALCVGGALWGAFAGPSPTHRVSASAPAPSRLQATAMPLASPSPALAPGRLQIRHSLLSVRHAAFLGEDRIVLLGKAQLAVLDLEGRLLRKFQGRFWALREGPTGLWLNSKDRALRLRASDLELEEVFSAQVLDCDPVREQVLVKSAKCVEIREAGGELVRALEIPERVEHANGFLLPRHVVFSAWRPRTLNLIALRDDPSSTFVSEPRFMDRVRFISISPDRERIATGSGAGWVLQGPASLETLEPLQRAREGGGLLATSVQAHNNKVGGVFVRGKWLLSYALTSDDPGECILWDLTTKKAKSIRDAKWIRALALSGSGRVAVVGRDSIEIMPLEEFR
jgi:protein kinase-like protein